ncbi:DUF6518 family protein [Streptomyces xiaopingdaonensis]|uniref:DUF6518 family protein n=1 Tax=Streptomyces xiaopingdaonensis TaxID=1565415 RepID=UPI00031774E9|nr:DUF6518 family protein [Streptomyces xiaopingdaonensis]
MSTTAHPTGTRAPVSAALPPWQLCGLALAAGLAAGALTSFGQTVLPGGWHALVNSASPWVAVAFLVGLRAPGRWRGAAAAGLLSQVGLVAGYFVTAEFRGFSSGMSSVLVWIVAGVVAGPVHGAAGALLKDDRRHVRTVAAGLTGSVWGVEGLHFLRLAADSGTGPGAAAGWCYLLVSLLLPLLLARFVRERSYALLTLVAGAGAVAASLVLLETALML